MPLTTAAIRRRRPHHRAIFLWTLGGLAASYIWLYSIGLAGAKTLGNQTAAGVQSLMGGGALGTLALVAIVFGAIASSAMNDYSGSLALQAGGVKVKRNWGAAAGTVLAFFLILWLHGGNTTGKFEDVLLFSAYWIAPFFAIILIDWHARQGLIDRESLSALMIFKKLPMGWGALLALVVGFAAMVPFMNTGLLVGSVATALHGADLSFYVGFLVAATAYIPLRRLGASH